MGTYIFLISSHFSEVGPIIFPDLSALAALNHSESCFLKAMLCTVTSSIPVPGALETARFCCSVPFLRISSESQHSEQKDLSLPSVISEQEHTLCGQHLKPPGLPITIFSLLGGYIYIYIYILILCL